MRLSAELGEQGLNSSWYATGRRGVSSLAFRGNELSGSYTGFADRPTYADARTIADDVIEAYVDGRLDRVEMVNNAYVSPLTQTVTHQRLLPLSHEAIAGGRTSPRSRRPSTTSEPRRSSGGWFRTTSRSRSTARSSSPPPASSAPR